MVGDNRRRTGNHAAHAGDAPVTEPTMKRRVVLAAGASFLGCPALGLAQASTWPARGPIRLRLKRAV